MIGYLFLFGALMLILAQTMEINNKLSKLRARESAHGRQKSRG